MYEAFYGLSEPPFRLTPDPHYLYLSTHHREALGHFRKGIHCIHEADKPALRTCRSGLIDVLKSLFYIGNRLRSQINAICHTSRPIL